MSPKELELGLQKIKFFGQSRREYQTASNNVRFAPALLCGTSEQPASFKWLGKPEQRFSIQDFDEESTFLLIELLLEKDDLEQQSLWKVKL